MLVSFKTLPEELLKSRENQITETQLLEDVLSILSENESQRIEIKSTLKEKCSTKSNFFDLDLLETNNIFHVNQIKEIAISHRLRFLDSYLFKNEIPEEAISKINALEKSHETILGGYKILAPSNAFNLKKYDDPLLFAPIGNGYYYLIHKWGNDLSWYRKLQVYPFKNLMTFLFVCFLISCVGALFFPPNRLSQSVAFTPVIVLIFLFKSVVAVGAYVFFMMGKNFNDAIWNRPFKEN